MRSLLALALALAAVHSAAGAAWWQPVRTGLNCSAACVRINKAAWAINGGSASRALCSVTLNNKRYHGTKADPAGTCSYTYLNAAGQAQAGVSGAAAGAFMCGCTTAGTCWVPGSCPTGSTGISPTNACVAEKSGSAAVMGWLQGSTCFIPRRAWGTNNAVISRVDKFGGSLNMRQACFGTCASTFSEGSVAKCAADGKLYKLEGGKLRQLPSKEIYASYGSPQPTFVDRSTSCCQLSRCAVGAALPTGSCSTLIGFTFYPGKESGWENIAGPGGVDNAPYKGLTAQQLAAKCGPKPHCEGFVRNGQTGEGWLKYGVRPSTTWGSLPTADGCTGLWVKNPPTFPTKCGKLERGIHFNGGDLTTCPELGGTCFYARGVNTIEACCNKCAEKAGCGAFTFKWQDEAHTLGSCALKAATGFTRSYWGEHHSAVIVPQCRVPSCTAYAQGTCKCTACQQGWLPSSGKCVSAAPVTLSAADPAFVHKARTVGLRQTLLVTNYLLEGDSKPSTLELKRKSMFLKGAKIVVQQPGGAFTKAAPDSRLFTGQVAGSPGSMAVLHVRAGGGVSGLAMRGNGSWALGRVGGANSVATLGSRKSRPGDRASLPPFTESHIGPPPTAAGGAGIASEASPVAAAATAAAATAQPANLLQTVFDQKWQAVVALEMDNAYMKQFKKEEDAIDYAADLVGYSDVVFSREVQVDLVIGYISMWPTSKPDPYSSQPDTDKVLDAFRGRWNGSDTLRAVKRTYAFLLSGLPQNQGLAWIGKLCESYLPASLRANNRAYGVCTSMGTGFKWDGDQSKNPEKTMWEVKCILHESGHIFGAPHTHEWCNLDGAIDTIDDCFRSNESWHVQNDMLVSDPVPCAQPGVSFGGLLKNDKDEGELPKCTSKATAWGGGAGTLMSYCNRIGSDLLGGGYSNIAWTFGKGHPCGRLPERVPGRMQAHVIKRSEQFPKRCFAAEPSDWWGWKLTIATAAGAWFWSGTGTDADVQVKWHCGNTDVTNGYVSLSRLCGTASYTRTKGSWGCFESGNVEQFTLQYYPDDTPATGALLAGNNPVPACLEAGVQPVLSIQIQGQGYTDRWEMDTTQLQLELQYVEKADGMLHIRSRTFKMCQPQGNVVFPNPSRTFTLCDQQPIKDCNHPSNYNNQYCAYCAAGSTGMPTMCVANGGNPCTSVLSTSTTTTTVELCNALGHSIDWSKNCPNQLTKPALQLVNQDSVLYRAASKPCGKPVCDGTSACADCRCPTGTCDALTKQCPCDGITLVDCTKCKCPNGQRCNSSKRCEVPPPTPQPCPDPTNHCDASCACPTDQVCKTCYLKGKPFDRCINSASRPCNPADGVMDNSACAPLFMGGGEWYRVCNTADNLYSFCAAIHICNNGVCRSNDFLGIANACVCVGSTCNETTGACQ